MVIVAISHFHCRNRYCLLIAMSDCGNRVFGCGNLASSKQRAAAASTARFAKQHAAGLHSAGTQAFHALQCGMQWRAVQAHACEHKVARVKVGQSTRQAETTDKELANRGAIA